MTAIAPVPINENSNPQTMPCVLRGVTGTLTRTKGATPGWTGTFTRSVAGDVVAVPDGSILAPTDIDYGRINIFWPGYNGADGGYDVSSDIAAMVAKCTGPYLVLSILNGDNAIYSALPHKPINDASIAAYGDKYVDVRQWMVNHYNPASSGDVLDYGNGGSTSRVPRSLRQDFIHLNDLGQYLTAEYLNQILIAKGWANDLSPGLDQIRSYKSFTSGVAVTGVLIGVTPGSTIVSNISGITVDNATRTYSGTPSLPAGGTVADAWVETKAGEAESPRSSPQYVTQQITDPGLPVIHANNGRLWQVTDDAVFADFAGSAPAVVGDGVALLTQVQIGNTSSAFNPRQESPPARPILRDGGSFKYLEFDAVDDFMTFTSALFNNHDNHTVIALIKPVGTGAGYVLRQADLGMAGNSAAFRLGFNSGRIPSAYWANLNGTPTEVVGTAVTEDWHVLTATRASDTSRSLRVDGVSAGTNTTSFGLGTLSKANSAKSPLTELYGALHVIALARVPTNLSAADALKVEQYLAALVGKTI